MFSDDVGVVDEVSMAALARKGSLNRKRLKKDIFGESPLGSSTFNLRLHRRFGWLRHRAVHRTDTSSRSGPFELEQRFGEGSGSGLGPRPVFCPDGGMTYRSARVRRVDEPRLAKRDAKQAVDELGGVVLVSAIQLALAFCVLGLSVMPPLRQFGIGLAIGLVAAALGAVWLVPHLAPRRGPTSEA